MKNLDLKKIATYALRNKAQIFSLMDYFKADDIEKGVLAIPSNLINDGLKGYARSQTNGVLTDYYVQFSQDLIYILIDLEHKQAGPINARYMFSITDFQFDSNAKTLVLSYKEDVKSKGNMLQSMALKALAMKGPLIKSVLDYSRCDFAAVSGDRIIIDFQKIPQASAIPENLTLSFISCRDDVLRLKFEI